MEQTTHPGYAALADPLFGFAIKRVDEEVFFGLLFNYLLPILSASLFAPQAERGMSSEAMTG